LNADELTLSRKVTDAILRAGVVRARFAVEPFSGTLSRAVTSYRDSDTHGAVHIPHYWAVFVNDGRRPFSMPGNRVMCWFRNPLNDPRLKGGNYPVNRADVRHMTRVDFEFWLEENRKARVRGVPVPMIVTRRITKPTQAKRFFSNNGGMFQFWQDANIAARPIVQAEITKLLGKDLNIKATLNLKF
jgi:hypothetical protein